jgi:hypothetical protein
MANLYVMAYKPIRHAGRRSIHKMTRF